MSKNLLFDCSYSEVWVHPKNFKTLTSKKSLELDWYVQCKFYDPIFKEKYPKGYPFRKRLNSYKTLEERKAAAEFLLKEIPKVLEVQGYNPITKKYMIAPEKPKTNSISSDMNFIDALEKAYLLLNVSPGVIKECKRIVAKLKKTAISLTLDFPISELHSGYIRDLLDPMELTNGEYNKYLTHISIIVSDLVEKRIMFHNPIRDIKKKKIVKKIRETIEIEDLRKVFKILKADHYTFYRYGMIFFHSGARSSELFRVQKKDLNIQKQEYKVIIMKGSSYKEIVKIILPNVLNLWKEIFNECKSDDDYLFAKNLQPDLIAIQPYQITKRWKRLVKDKLDVTADFYALKHLFLDELDKATDNEMKYSKELASHTTNITETVYLVGRSKRKNEALKKLKIDIL